MHTLDRLLDSLRIEGTGVPIYVQLREQFLRAIGAGLLAPGDRMPTMRQVAVAVRVDLNTVRRAYDELGRAGALRLERGRGSFVARPPAPLPPQAQTEAADTLARKALAQAASMGVEPKLLIQRLAALTAKKEKSDER
jgi:GntR family transcriptional regulator